jgi:hypothetical protein
VAVLPDDGRAIILSIVPFLHLSLFLRFSVHWYVKKQIYCADKFHRSHSSAIGRVSSLLDGVELHCMCYQRSAISIANTANRKASIWYQQSLLQKAAVLHKSVQSILM